MSTQRNLVDAWREHCATATLAQLSCTTAMQEHLNQFQSEVVRAGLARSTLDGHADVQCHIASFTESDVVVPDAKVLHCIANSFRTILSAQLVRDLANAACDKAGTGHLSMNVPIADATATAKLLFEVDDNVRSAVLKRVEKKLEEVGFKGNGREHRGGRKDMFKDMYSQEDMVVQIAWS
jgi:hypothetical protein